MELIEKLKRNNKYAFDQLTKTGEKSYNVERIKSLKELKTNLVFQSTMNCIKILEEINPPKYLDVIAETLLWMDIAKTGTKKERKDWQKKDYNLYSHNLGSAEIYKEHSTNFNQIVYILIKTHGLVGQHIKGELNLYSSKDLYSLIEQCYLTKEDLKNILLVLNECIIKEVSIKIYESIKDKIERDINNIINNNFEEVVDVKERLCALNNNKVDTEKLDKILENKVIKDCLVDLLDNNELWYYSSGLKHLDIENQIKILLIIYVNINSDDHIISFFKLMQSMYLDYKDVKRVNLYKLRIIEDYLDSITYEMILRNNIPKNINISCELFRDDNCLSFDFAFSLVATKLIEFCEVAYISNSLYNKSVLLLYDLFGFRRDSYDRFYNEIEYLQTMNSTIKQKARILDFIVGDNVLDVGPGGGALMDLILETYSDVNVYGIDISANVIDELEKKKINENKKYNLVKGNALNLEEYFAPNSIDTVIYCSIIHELFSYIEYDGKKFNYETIKKALKSAYDILPVKGRIIIRDGIKTEGHDKRIVEFKNKDDMKILENYKNDFKGRDIVYEVINDHTVKLDVNDAMEFLYTYTWGESSYPMEVQEQFGYFTPSEYEAFVKENLPNSKIVYMTHFLQDGYEENLLPKISIYDEDYNPVRLPDSTFIMAIEKEK